MSRTVSLGKYGSFKVNDLVGQPYGLSYDIVDRGLKVVPPRTIVEVGMIAYNDVVLTKNETGCL